MVTLGWLVAPGLTGDAWRYVSSTCGGQCVMTFGVLLMHVLLADNWDIQALVSSAVCSLYFSSPCTFTINNNTYFNPTVHAYDITCGNSRPPEFGVYGLATNYLHGKVAENACWINELIKFLYSPSSKQ